MRVMVIGSGGREHALCWAIAGSPLLTKLWCAPGNPGIAAVAECVPIRATDVDSLVAFAVDNDVDLVVPGPEAPLVAGLANEMRNGCVACCGPGRDAAMLEGSKSFAKELCEAAGIPTARWERFDDAEAAREFVRRRGAPIVVKADGLAAGKGVVVAETDAEAVAAIDAFMDEGRLGDAGRTVLLEERLQGEELSFFALCDGAHAIPLTSARDYKRAGDGDTGPNTGGMGAISPWPGMNAEHETAIMAGIIQPALAELARRGTPFRGVLFAGLMHTEDGLKLIEFNVRFGDPECQAMMLRLKSDLLPALQAACDGELAHFDLRWEEQAAIAVVLATHGYPDAPPGGGEIRSLDRAASVPGVRIFHAGTEMDVAGRLLAAGGRALTVCAIGINVGAAREAAYAAVKRIDWPGGFCRHDIGLR